MRSQFFGGFLSCMSWTMMAKTVIKRGSGEEKNTTMGVSRRGPHQVWRRKGAEPAVLQTITSSPGLQAASLDPVTTTGRGANNATGHMARTPENEILTDPFIYGCRCEHVLRYWLRWCSCRCRGTREESEQSTEKKKKTWRKWGEKRQNPKHGLQRADCICLF